MTVRLTVFLDRDGIINRKPPDGQYVTTWAEFEFLPGVKEALRALKQAGARLVLITNQQGIARGALTEEALQAIHDRMQRELAAVGAALDALYYCPHEEGQCDCRKPRTGLFRRAITDFPDIDLAHAIVVGDSLSDTQAAASLGCRGIVIVHAAETAGAGPGTLSPSLRPIVAASLEEAVFRYVLPQSLG